MKNRGCFTYILVIVIAIVASAFFSGAFENEPTYSPDEDDYSYEYPDYDDYDDDISDEKPDDSNQAGVNNTPNRDPEDFENVDKLYYSQLTSEEKMIYEVVLDGVKNGESKFIFKDVYHENYLDRCFRAICALTYDHPEYFWLQCGCNVTTYAMPYSIKGDVELEVMEYAYWEYSLDKERKKTELDNAVSKVASMAAGFATDYEKIEFVHDYLIENAIYDHDALDQYYQTFHNASCEYIFSAYGCLINGKTVCSGYAKAFQLIMRELGYDCRYVVGDAGEAHAWNCIFIENEGYFIDITWDDSDYTHDEARYDYFCITEEDLTKTHTIDPDFNVPDCTAEKYNYFKYNDFEMDTYTFEGICDIIEEQADRYIINIRFSSYYELERACVDLIDSGKCSTIPALKNRGEILYSVNDDHYILSFYLE